MVWIRPQHLIKIIIGCLQRIERQMPSPVSKTKVVSTLCSKVDDVVMRLEWLNASGQRMIINHPLDESFKTSGTHNQHS